MKIFMRFSLFLLCVVSMTSCGEKSAEKVDFVSSRMPAADELPHLREAAMAGSQGAAMQMSLWQLKDKQENLDPLFWTRIAAENGNSIGQYNLAVALMKNHEDRLSYTRGVFWLKKAANSGDKKAIELLSEIAD